MDQKRRYKRDRSTHFNLRDCLLRLDFSPNLPMQTNYVGNWLSKPVEWIRSADTKGIVQRTLIYAIAFFVLIFLLIFLCRQIMSATGSVNRLNGSEAPIQKGSFNAL